MDGHTLSGKLSKREWTMKGLAMNSTIITDKKGRRIELREEEEMSRISAYHRGSRLGAFEFDFREGAMPGQEGLLVTHMFLDEEPGYLNVGIGTGIVQWVEELYDMAVLFGNSDGSESEDGSHLIGHGAGFAESILRKRRNPQCEPDES